MAYSVRLCRNLLHGGALKRAAIALAQDWRSDKIMHKLEALLIVANKEELLIVSGTGEVIDPDDGNGLEARSSAQCQHVRSVATSRIYARTGNVGPVILGEVRETLALLLDL